MTKNDPKKPEKEEPEKTEPTPTPQGPGGNPVCPPACGPKD